MFVPVDSRPHNINCFNSFSNQTGRKNCQVNLEEARGKITVA
jgi:hypothetical protein